MCMSWMIFACTKGYGGWINEFLSWEAFGTLSKLTYCVYLIHYTLLIFFYPTMAYNTELTGFLLVRPKFEMSTSL